MENKIEYLDNQIERSKKIVNQAEKYFAKLDEVILDKNPSEKRWSIAQILEHLNLYADHYNPTLLKAVQNLQSSELDADDYYKPKQIGKWFTNSMAPKQGVVKMKMGTAKDKNPFTTGVRANVYSEFIKQQNEFIELLKQAKEVNINYKNVKTTLGKFLTLTVGDTINVLVNHNERHFIQALGVLSDVN